MTTTAKNFNILLIDSDEAARQQVKASFADKRILNRLFESSGIGQGMELLVNDLSRDPLIILVDQQLLDDDSLKLINDTPSHEATFVFLLSTCAGQGCDHNTHDQSIAGFIDKQSPGDDFFRMAKTIDGYWSAVAAENDSSDTVGSGIRLSAFTDH